MARLLSKSLPPPAEATVTEYLDKIRRMRTLPRSIKPQLPHSDYVRFASIIASEMNILPSPSLRRRHRVFMPALFAMSNRYMSSDATSNGTSDGERVMSEMNEMMNKYKDGFGIALHIFQSLQGTWQFERSLDSELDSSPSGTVSGHVDFTVLSPKSASELSSEEVLANTTTYTVFTSKIFPDLLYEENGVFKTNKGFSFDVSRRYIYTYNNTQDSLDIYFAKAVSHDTVINSQSTSNTSSASNINTGESLSRNITPQAMSTSAYERDYLFVSLSFVATEQGWLGTACHPCGKDLYNSKFLFALRGVFLDNMRIEYTVKGPHKDYLSVTTLKR